MTDCIFCKIANHQVPVEIELETEKVVIFPSNDPVAETHLLIVPKTHISSFMNLEESHDNIFLDMEKAAQEIIKKKNITGGYKLIFNGGKYQAVPHIHWHLLAGKLEEEDNAENRT